MNNSNGDITDKHWLNNKQVISLLLAVIVATFTVTSIIMEFRFVQSQLNTLEQRLDKRYNRSQDAIEELQNKVNELEKPDSDTNKK